MQNELVTRGASGLAISGAPIEVLRTDIKIPHICLGQGLSDVVIEKKCEVGDIYRSSNSEILGNPINPVDCVFLHYPQTNWIIEKKLKGDKWKYHSIEPRNALNEREPWSFFADENGVVFKDKEGNLFKEGDKGAYPWRRVKQLKVFAILLSDIIAAKAEIQKAEDGELPDPSKALTPVCFSFRSTGYDAGKELCTFVTKANSMEQPGWKYVVQMGVFIDKNDDGTFAVWKADTSKPKGVPKDLLPLVDKWAQMVNKNMDKIKTDEEVI